MNLEPRAKPHARKYGITVSEPLSAAVCAPECCSVQTVCLDALDEAADTRVNF